MKLLAFFAVLSFASAASAASRQCLKNQAAPDEVKVYLSEAGPAGINPLQPKPALTFASGSQSTSRLPTFDLYPDQLKQRLDGFGAALTESCAITLMKLDPRVRGATLEKVFSRDKGAGLNLIRLPVGASDFADGKRGSYTYDDTPGHKPDPQFRHFDMSRDEKTFRLLREAIKLNPDLRVMLSPWTAPPWMKTVKGFNGGSLDFKYAGDFANYLVKVIQEIEKRGIPVHSLTAQNEPGYANDFYPSMGMTAAEQIRFFRDHLGPALKKAGLKTKIYAHDHNWDMSMDDVLPILDDAGAKKALGGVAYHCYGGHRWQMLDTMKKHPDVPHLQTECTGSMNSDPVGDFQWWLDNQSLGAVAMGTTGALGWNLCLDENGGPQNGGCSQCRGTFTNDFSGNAPKVVFNAEFHALAQVSRFTDSKSRRMEVKADGVDNPQAVAFLNEDGERVFVAQNPTDAAIKFRVRAEDCREIVYEIPAQGAVTMTWRPAVSGRPARR